MIKAGTRLLQGLHVRRVFVWPRAEGMCPSSEALKEVEDEGRAVELPRGSPKDKTTASNQAAREEESAKPQCAFIYQSPTPHEEKITNLDLQRRAVVQT